MSREAPIEIVPYNASWPERFESERLLLLTVIGRWIAGPIEHVGSTAVPGLASKPIIDIMAGIDSLDASLGALQALEQIDYCYAPYRADVMHWFCKPSPAHRTHHLHLVPVGSRLWVERLAFRDCLRRRPDVAAEYAALKQHLAEQHRFDRESYTDAKGPFIERVIELALTPASDNCSR